MKVAGIIAEYNPFHNGHEYHLKVTRDHADAVVAVMSGNFVQRAEPAVMSKFSRAEAAVRCGVDIVIELPVCWAMASAQRFASGGVSLLDSLGCVDILSFGSESAELPLILKAAKALDSKEVSDLIKSKLGVGSTFASIREKAVEELYGADISSVLKSPNDILAVEYCRELSRLNSKIEPLVVTRKNVMHDSEDLHDGFASASLIRQRLRSGEGVLELMPNESFAVAEREADALRSPADLSYLERAILMKLRQMTPQELGIFPDVSEGIENRILDYAKKCDSLEKLFDSVKTKRYTHSRIRRIVMSAFLGIDKIPQRVPYARVLAFNETGEELLKTIKITSSIPIITKKSDLNNCSDEVKAVFELEYRSTEVFSLLTPKATPSGSEFSSKIFKKSVN